MVCGVVACWFLRAMNTSNGKSLVFDSDILVSSLLCIQSVDCVSVMLNKKRVKISESMFRWQSHIQQMDTSKGRRGRSQLKHFL